MIAGADSIDDMGLLRHRATLGSVLRDSTFGHGSVMVNLDGTIIEVHGHAKQGSGYGYSEVHGLNALLATATSAGGASVLTSQCLRKGSCVSPRGAAQIIGDILVAVKRQRNPAATDQAVGWDGFGVVPQPSRRGRSIAR